jgi:hypothetical protein
VSLTGVPPTCVDFPLRAEGIQTSKAYKVTIGDNQCDEVMSFYYSPGGHGSSGASKVAKSGSRVDYYQLSALSCV